MFYRNCLLLLAVVAPIVHAETPPVAAPAEGPAVTTTEPAAPARVEPPALANPPPPASESVSDSPPPATGIVPASPKAEKPAPKGPMITLTTAMGTTLDAYVVGPEDATKGILILHDRWGLNDTARLWADRFAARGYRALAIDVFDGRTSNKYGLATEIMKATDPEAVKIDIRAGLKYLRAPGRKIATLGAGYGGWQSFQAALMAPDAVAATVVLYAPVEATPEQILAFKAPILAIFARDDIALPPARVADYERRFKKALVRYSGHIVNADHGFADRHYSGAYNEKLVQEVWQEIDGFLADFVE